VSSLNPGRLKQILKYKSIKNVLFELKRIHNAGIQSEATDSSPGQLFSNL
jgi:hypothetical protein